MTSSIGNVASRVVVGFDGSEEARRALDWALQEAGIRHAPLRVVAAVQERCLWSCEACRRLRRCRRRIWPPNVRPGRLRTAWQRKWKGYCSGRA